ncbi:hypothetical protein [Methanosarcina horonobensis]|uniref:hypothetical protein n=1 Tax=Methanosarcina horonobensis TaxID=418008 RepID=UPI0022B8D141|nr:hypothetical protein [Methanosarcina horonobensis]
MEKKEAELRAVSNSVDDDFKQSTIDDLIIAIRSLNSFLDQLLVCNSIDYDLRNRFERNEINWNDYTKKHDGKF